MTTAANWQCRDLRKAFGARRGRAQPVLDGVTLEIPAGQITCLLGPSGVGKTTFARCLAGLETPDGGEIRHGDRLLNDPAIRVAAHQRRVGMIFQGLALWPHRTVAGHLKVALAGARVPRRERQNRTARMLELVGMTTLARRYPSRLSGGEQQRLAIARALCTDPQLLIADEPFAGFEDEVRAPIRDELRRMTGERQLGTLFITHDRAEALALADQLAVIRNGRIEQCGPPATLWRAPATAFVARFVAGHSLLSAVRRDDGGVDTAVGVCQPSNDFDGTRGLAVLDWRSVTATPTGADGSVAGTVTACRLDASGRWKTVVRLGGGEELAAASEGFLEIGSSAVLRIPRSVRVLAADE